MNNTELYMDKLLKQYVSAKGYNLLHYIKLKKAMQSEDGVYRFYMLNGFYEWLKNQRRQSNTYYEILKNKYIIKRKNLDNDLEIAEVGKGINDSLTMTEAYKSDINTHIEMVTPYAQNMQIEENKLDILGNYPFINSEVDGKSVSRPAFYDLYLTQNENNMSELVHYASVINASNGEVCIGMYGNTSDADKSKKWDAISYLTKKIDPGKSSLYYEQNKDEYYFLLHGKDKCRIKKK